jgi:hypothetical protein
MAAMIRLTKTFSIVAKETVRFSMSAISGPSLSFSLLECCSWEPVNVLGAVALFVAKQS